MFVRAERYIITDRFESFGCKCIEIYELDPAHFLSATGVAWQSCLKETEIELELLTVIHMPNGRKGKRGGLCHTICQYAKVNNKYMKGCYQNKESS